MDVRQIPAVSKQVEKPAVEAETALWLRLLAEKQAADTRNPDKLLVQLSRERQSLDRVMPDRNSDARELLGATGRYRNMNCMRCHVVQPSTFEIPRFNYGSVDRYSGGESYQPIDDPAQREAREIEQFAKESTSEKALHIFSRLPKTLTVDLKEQSIKLSTNFVGALEAIPGIKVPPVAKDCLACVRSVELKGNNLSFEFEKAQRFAIDLSLPMVGRVTHLNVGADQSKLSFDISMDVKDPKEIELKSIRGLSLSFDDGKSIAIKSIRLLTNGESPLLIATIENPLRGWPDTIPLPIPINKFIPSLNNEDIRDVLKLIVASKGVLQSRDFTSVLDVVSDADVKAKLDGMLKDLKTISKDGSRITIERNNWETTHDFGGPVVSVNRRVAFDVGNDVRHLQLSNIRGINFALPLPSELGIGSRFLTNLTEVSLLGVGGGGNRSLLVKTGNVIDSVHVKLAPTMSPISDSQGNWCADVRMLNPIAANGRDRLKLSLRFDNNGQLNMKSSEIASIISDATWQAADLSVPGFVSAGASAVSQIASSVFWMFE